MTRKLAPQMLKVSSCHREQCDLKICCSISGIFFVLPCIESYQKVDLRTITLGVPPQEVSNISFCIFSIKRIIKRVCIMYQYHFMCQYRRKYQF